MKVTASLPFWALAATSLSSAEGRMESPRVMGARKDIELRLPASFDLMTELLRNPIGWDRLFEQQDGRSMTSPASSPPYSIHDNENDMTLEIELPGASANELKVEVEDRQLLLINGAHRRVGISENITFDMEFNLAKNVDSEKMKVTLSNGILQVKVPKREPVVRRLEVISQSIESIDVPKPQSSKTDVTTVERVDGMEITTED